MSVRDLDVKNRSSWQGALDMLLALCGEAADLSFDCRDMGGWKLPTVEIRLDKPEELTLPAVQQQGNMTVERWRFGTVVLADDVPAALPEDAAWLLRPDGAASVTYRAFKEMIRLLQAVELPAEFAWSSIPLASLCQDAAILAEKEQACYTLGAVHTLWVRNADDEAVKAAVKKAGACGQIRMQNMVTANTWVGGETYEKELLEKLK